VGLVVAVPAAQGGVAGVGEKKWQRRRFNVAVAKYHVGFASHGVVMASTSLDAADDQSSTSPQYSMD
jgi:hypothetical protein